MEKVLKIEWKPKWDGGDPMPRVFCDGQKVFLTYRVADWDRDSVNLIQHLPQGPENGELLALVIFNGYTLKFGVANDEVFHGLPLYKNGLDEWAHIIEDSGWIEEIKSIHRVHPCFNPFRWMHMKHYVLLFKDQLLEVIAKDFTIEIFETSSEVLRLEVLKRMD